MGNLFLPFLFLCLVCFMIGIINPNLVITWGDVEKRNRKNIFKYYGTRLAITLVLYLIFAPKNDDTTTIILGLLLFVFLFCLVCLIIGNKKPDIIITWGYTHQRSRKNVFKYYGTGLIFTLGLIFVLSPSRMKIFMSIVALLMLIWLFCLFCLIIGCIKPNLVIGWGDVEKRNTKYVFKYYGTGLIFTLGLVIFAGVCINIGSPTNQSNTTQSVSSNTQSEQDKKAEQDKKDQEAKKAQELEKQKQEIKSLEEKYKPLLESGKSYANMTDEEGKTANELISNWNKLEQEFKTSYQSQKDSISKSIDEYNAKKKAEQEAQKAAEEKASYDTGITYSQLARTPDDYKGKRVKFTGKVIQVMEGTTENDLRVAVNGDYDNVLFVGYNPSILKNRILENDNITLYGESIGIYTYKSTLGASISIPGLYADKIELNK